jgi:serine/threonine protein kinase
MFADPAPHSPMRLIDFGSGCIDPVSPSSKSSNNDDDLPMHTTFAGSAFYISPELFQRSYNLKTDVWSAGVALYVLVAGYPADELQKAFNILQTGGKGRNLRKLPNLPEDLPDSFYEMLEAALTYRHKKRPRAQQLLEGDFAQFHKQLLSSHDAAAGAVVPLSLDEVASAAAAAPDPAVSFGGTLRDSSASNPSAGAGRGGASMRLKGSVRKHSIFLDFKNFERSLTAVLATMLSKRELEQLVKILTERVTIQEPLSDKDAAAAAAPDGSSAAPTVESGSSQILVPAASAPPAVLSQASSLTLDGSGPPPSNELRLGVILISELKAIIRDELRSAATIETIEKLPNEKLYSSFAYHVTLLHEFLFGTGGGARSSAGRRRVKRTNSFSHGLKPGVRTMTGSNPSIRSGSGSLRGGTMMTNRSTTGGSMPAPGAAAVKTIPNSVHGSSVFAGLRARNKTQSVPDFGAPAAPGAGGTGSGLA